MKLNLSALMMIGPFVRIVKGEASRNLIYEFNGVSAENIL